MACQTPLDSPDSCRGHGVDDVAAIEGEMDHRHRRRVTAINCPEAMTGREFKQPPFKWYLTEGWRAIAPHGARVVCARRMVLANIAPTLKERVSPLPLFLAQTSSISDPRPDFRHPSAKNRIADLSDLHCKCANVWFVEPFNKRSFLKRRFALAKVRLQ